MTVQLKGPYRKIEYSLYRPAKGEAYRPLQGAKVDPTLIKKKSPTWKMKKVNVKYSQSNALSTVRAFFDFPRGGEEESQKERAKLQLMILLGQIASVLMKNNFTLPVVYLGQGSKEIYDAIKALLIAVQGEGTWEGTGCGLDRSWLIQPTVWENASCASRDMIDYISGWNEDGEKFWVGYAESAVAIKADVDETIRNEILKTSEFMVPILFEKPGRKKAGHTEIKIQGTCLIGLQTKTKSCLANSGNMHEWIEQFICDFHENVKYEYNERKMPLQDIWRNRIELYRPPMDQKNHEQSIEEEDLWCAAMAFLEQLLDFLKNYGILKKTDADEILYNYGNWVLPGSPQMRVIEPICRPVALLNQPVSSGKYDDLDIFYEFLWEYEFCVKHLCEKAKHGSLKCRGILHTLKRENEEYFIAPRDKFLQEYQQWLDDNAYECFPFEDGWKKWEDKLYEAGVKLKRSDKGKDSWRYQYYKDQPPV
ncbi:hypothetical protein B5G28_09950 [Faecalibacterium sp. An77]|nr:hypothetical protein B5G28_09950 [Faecalibacterium sp. An77]